MELTEDIICKHVKLIEAKVHVKGYVKHSKKGKTFNVKAHDRNSEAAEHVADKYASGKGKVALKSYFLGKISSGAALRSLPRGEFDADNLPILKQEYEKMAKEFGKGWTYPSGSARHARSQLKGTNRKP